MKHNTYFDGKVQSLGLETDRGPATVGVITRGTYTFNTSSPETMVVASGVLWAKLPGKAKSVPFRAGRRFKVPANSSFEVRAEADAAYLCYYG
jgi:uncharacterized protein YaiE (UPF0345 family)